MSQVSNQNRTVWVIVGMIAGLCFANIWPHEPALADSTDRSKNFAILTVPVGVLEAAEGVFILDFLTGRLTGAILNTRNGLFTHKYLRNVAQDFRVKDPNYAIVSRQAILPNQGRIRMAGGVIYIAEMTSGKIICYGFPYSSSNKPGPIMPLRVISQMSFREATLGE